MCAVREKNQRSDLGHSPRDRHSRDILEPEHAEHVLLALRLDRPVRVARPDPARVKLVPLTLGVAAQVALELRRTGPLWRRE